GIRDDLVTGVQTCALPISCRQETAKLHAGDPENTALWKQFMPWCLEELDRVYRRLDVRFDHTHGESFYNPMLPDVVKDLLAKGIDRKSTRLNSSHQIISYA